MPIFVSAQYVISAKNRSVIVSEDEIPVLRLTRPIHETFGLICRRVHCLNVDVFCQKPCDGFVLICRYRPVKRNKHAVARSSGGVAVRCVQPPRCIAHSDIQISQEIVIRTVGIEANNLPIFDVLLEPLSVLEISANKAADIFAIVSVGLLHRFVLCDGFASHSRFRQPFKQVRPCRFCVFPFFREALRRCRYRKFNIILQLQRPSPLFLSEHHLFPVLISSTSPMPAARG